MITSHKSNSPSRSRLTTLVALGVVFAVALMAIPAANAADPVKPQTANKTLPLTAAFVKAPAGEPGPQYSLNLKNDSASAIKASAKIHLSVVVHNAPKMKDLPAQAIAPGQVWTIRELSSHDKVVVTAEGFAPLELTVP